MGGIDTEDNVYRGLAGEIAKEKQMRRLTYMEIARMAGMKYSTVKAFMSGKRRSDRSAKALAAALNIEL